MAEWIKGRGITYPRGFTANGLYSGIKKAKKRDLMLFLSAADCRAAGVFTTNIVKASCVNHNLALLKARKSLRAVIANSGNANCLTGKEGMTHTEQMASGAAKALHIKPKEVFVASTGVIGQPLPIHKVREALPELALGMGASTVKDWASAEAILTTDTCVKQYAVRVKIDGKDVRIGAMAKGSGMIYPTMTAKGLPQATMLCFVSTDAAIDSATLQRVLDVENTTTFNRISVDSDQSTNDMVLILANGLAGNAEIRKGTEAARIFAKALSEIFVKLAHDIVRDGEGVTKLVEVRIQGAKNEREAVLAGRAISTSMLVKTALFGCDPNWGRIAASVGSSQATVRPDRLKVWIGAIQVLDGDRGLASNAKRLRKIFEQEDIRITVDLGAGRSSAVLWTSDLSTQYVKINSAYRT